MLAVLYDTGSASPSEIVHAVRDLSDVLFVLSSPDDSGALAEYFSCAGHVCGLSDALSGAMDKCIAGVVTFSERLLKPASILSSRLGLPGHALPVVERLTDKTLQRRSLPAEISNPSLPLTSASDWQRAVAELGMPLIIKPRRGAGSVDTYRIESRTHGDILLSDVEFRRGSLDLLAESLMVGKSLWPYGDYVSVESAIVEGAITHLHVTGKFPLLPPFREPGQFWPAPAQVSLSDVTRVTTLALRSIGVTDGITHTEIKLTDAGPRIIEVNGRLGGFMEDLSRRSVGASLVRLAAEIALGLRSRPEPLAARDVCFQYSSLAPIEQVVLRAIGGRREARKVPGILGHRPFVRPGTSVGGGVATGELDMLFGTCARHEDMFTIIDSALDRLTYEFEGTVGGIMTGGQLRSHNRQAEG